ncbi:MAG TPA: hypothetical protein DCY13_14555 [Verrucomicrobiales bacterium]|nr:hypothetical protein [Verrucomicrobiales bacterium]
MFPGELPAGPGAFTTGARALLHCLIPGEAFALGRAKVAKLGAGFGGDSGTGPETTGGTGAAEALAGDAQFQALRILPVTIGQMFGAVTDVAGTFHEAGGAGLRAVVGMAAAVGGMIGGRRVPQSGKANGGGAKRKHHLAPVQCDADGGGFHDVVL